MKKKKIRVKGKNFGILLGCIIFVFVVIMLFPKTKEKSEISYQEYIGKSINELEKDNDSKIINKEYQYNNDYQKDIIVEINQLGEEINVIISKGKIDDNVYKEYNVNELGNVPIMMYHGIVDTKDNQYTGGNVGKDGYNRTSDAFRKDLEFYYEKGYRMIRLIDYANGIIDVPLGLSPIVLTFDDGNKNNFNVLGRNEDGSLKIDPNCAIGILEEFKKKHPDASVTATFFVMDGLFNQKEYDEEILHWLVDNGYDVGNHTTTHPDFTTISISKTQEVVGKMYQKLDNLLKDKYVKIVALPFGSPYKKSHANYPYILKGEYNGNSYETEVALRVGWEPEVSPFNKNFDKTFLKRCRAYDNNGKEFDIEMVFKNLEKNKYISDGDKDLVVIKKNDEIKIKKDIENIYVYGG
jgi:peptidoglycan/xylan/chitin deacetylase (PgdA/CDA1 family)